MAREAEHLTFLLEADCEGKIGIICMDSVDFATISYFPTLRTAVFQKFVPSFFCFKSMLGTQNYWIELDWGELSNGDSVHYGKKGSGLDSQAMV